MRYLLVQVEDGGDFQGIANKLFAAGLAVSEVMPDLVPDGMFHRIAGLEAVQNERPLDRG